MKVVLAVAVCFLMLCTFTAHSENTPLIENQKSCYRDHFKSYDSWLNILKSKKKNFNAERFQTYMPRAEFDKTKSTIACNDFTYSVDGLTVEGYYLLPRKTKAKKLPVIIFNRGGNGSFGYVIFGKKRSFLSDLAAQGFIVIGSQYRGGSGRIKNNGEDEFGGADVNDVLKLVDLLKEIPEADINRVALVGWSRGVMQSYIAAQSMPKVKAIVSIAGNTDAEKALKWRPFMEGVYKKRIPDFAKNRSAELAKRSVVNWLDKLPATAPILLIHGAKDKRVNVQQSIDFAEQLKSANRPHKLIVYPEDNHGLFSNISALPSTIADWLLTHI